MSAPHGRRWWFVGATLAAFILAAAFCADAAVQSWFAQHQTPGGLRLARAVTRWGDWPAHVAAGLLGALLAYVSEKREWLVIFAGMVIACALAGGVNRAIKMTAGRSRPSVATEASWNGPTASSKYHSFPSGHTVSSTAFFAVFLLARRRVGFALLLVPAVIAASRLYLNAHFLSDVVFAALLGLACAILVWRFLKRRYPLRTLERVP